MSKINRAVEWIKTGLIVVLLTSSAVLAWQTGLFSELSVYFPLLGDSAGVDTDSAGETESDNTVKKEAARPLCIVINDENGARCGVRYDTDLRNTMYNRTSSIFSEALGSVSAPSEVSEEEWRSALSGPGVYYEYLTPVRLAILNGWFDANMRSNEYGDATMIRRMIVAFGEDRSRLYYQDSQTNVYYGADTASAAGKAQELVMFIANGASFAFELSEPLSELAPYMMISKDNTHPIVQAIPAVNDEEIMTMIIDAAKHGSENNTTYYNLDTLVCVGTQFNIRVDKLGRTYYRRTGELTATEETYVINEGELIDQARIIIADTINKSCADAEVFVESHGLTEDGSYIIYFDYYIAGGRINLFEEGHAARITFIDGIVVEMELNFRRFLLTEETIGLLPERQALAAAGGEFGLSYSDFGSERLIPVWTGMGT